MYGIYLKPTVPREKNGWKGGGSVYFALTRREMLVHSFNYAPYFHFNPDAVAVGWAFYITQSELLKENCTSAHILLSQL